MTRTFCDQCGSEIPYNVNPFTYTVSNPDGTTSTIQLCQTDNDALVAQFGTPIANLQTAYQTALQTLATTVQTTKKSTLAQIQAAQIGAPVTTG
jgi:hypothetical protein